MKTSTALKEHPILFGGQMVRAILEGQKTMARRVVKGPIPEGATSCGVFSTRDETLNGRWQFLDGDPEDADSWSWIGEDFACPYGKPGDRLWVKSGYSTKYDQSRDETIWSSGGRFIQTHGKPISKTGKVKKDGNHPGMFMPSWLSAELRFPLLEITDVRVERLQEITEEDAIAEGLEPTRPLYGDCGGYVHEGHKDAFIQLWEKLNAERGYGWDANPWVWVVSFKRI